MGRGLMHISGIRRLAWIGGAVFAVLVIFKYVEFPYGDVISSLFSASKIHMTKTESSYPTNCLGSNTSVTYKNTSNLLHNFTKEEASTKDVVPLANVSSVIEVPRKKQKRNVVSISEMRNILVHNRASSNLKKPMWPSRADQELLQAKLQIENSTISEDDPNLYPSVFRNISIFRR
ncbi:exostosin-like protein [Artemisia annua]|uniref:Exostosin-like protein n=1 Tax=Artemisia annua TaxID=35608 RepID=A0A2U1NHC3_ARTAN|nr:exostosin-like protein [Artemisia annua]